MFYLQEVAGGGNCLLRLREKAISYLKGIIKIVLFPPQESRYSSKLKIQQA